VSFKNLASLAFASNKDVILVEAKLALRLSINPAFSVLASANKSLWFNVA